MPIQGIDAGALINALRAGREDRAKADKAQAETVRQKRISDVLGRVYGDSPSTGTIGGYASSAPKRESFDEAFSPQAMAAGFPQETPITQPRAAPQAPPRRPNPNVLAELIAIDPEMGSKVISAFKTMDEANLKALETKNTVLGAASRWLEGVPEQQRGAALQQILPQLLSAGWKAEEIEGKSLDNQSLRGYQSQAIDLDKMIDNELAEREFQAGKTVPVTGGGNVAIIKPDGSARWAIGGGAPSANIASPRSKADYDALPPGAQYIAPDGTTRTKPGGGGGNATGNFPGVER